jgi:hypothetical protein
MGNMKNVYKVLVGNSEGKRPHVSPRRGWEHKIQLFLGKYGGEE